MSEKLRVYELAKEMLTDSKIILRVMTQMGLDAKNHMSTLDQPTAQKIRDVLTGKAKLRTETKAQAKAEAPKARAPEPRLDLSPRHESTRPVERSTPRPPGAPADRAANRQSWLGATRPVMRSDRPVMEQRPPQKRPAQSGSSSYGQPVQAKVTHAPQPPAGWRPAITSPVVGPRPYTPGPTRSLPPKTARDSVVVRPEQTKTPLVQQPAERVTQDTPADRPAKEPARVVEAPEQVQVKVEQRAPERRQTETEAQAPRVVSVRPSEQVRVDVQPKVETHEAAESVQAVHAPAAAEAEEAKPAAAPRTAAEQRPESAAEKTGDEMSEREARTPAPAAQHMRDDSQPRDFARERPATTGRARTERPANGPAYRQAAYDNRPRPAGQAVGQGGYRDRRPGQDTSATLRPQAPAGRYPDQRPPRPDARPDARKPFVQQGPRPTPSGGQSRPVPRRPIDLGPRPAPKMPIVPVPSPAPAADAPQRPGGPRKPKQAPVQPVYAKRERKERSEEGQRLSKLRKVTGRRPAELRPRGTEPPKEVTIEGPIMVKDLASKMALSASEIIKRLLTQGIMVTINQELDTDTAQLVGMQMGIPVKYKAPELTAEEKVEQQALEEDAPEALEPRPPVVTVMGHVDHGKTSLLDAIRETDVASREAGGITQHIGASVVEIGGRKIVFLDTPGHEAFTAMRARGAEATDIAVLVVAADDGVMPQTVEAINHAKAAGVPIVVALNKMDKHNASPERVKSQLLEQQLVAEDWGGQTIVVPVSAKDKSGINDLLEMILLTAEMEELKANPNRLARGFVIEAQLDKGRGPVATVLVQNGTLRIGDAFVTGSTYGRVRAMVDDKGRRLKKAGPSTPVEVVGLTDLPQAGDIFQAVDDEKIAREIAAQRSLRKRASDTETTRKISLEDLFQKAGEGEVRDLNIVIKADVQGTLEAIRKALEGLRNEEVRVSIVHEGVGGVNESDIMLASASDAIILAFNVRPDAGARRVAEAEKVQINTYRVIYDAIDDIKAALKGMLKPKVREVTYGRAEVRQVFKVPKVGTIAGCYVTDGKALRSASVRLIRDSIVLHEGKIASLKRFKDDAREVNAGFECGIGLERFQDLQEGDVLEFYGQEQVKQA